MRKFEYELLHQHTVSETKFHRANTCSLRPHRDTCILANFLELTEPPTSTTTSRCCQLLVTDTIRLTASLPVVPALLGCGPKSPWVVCMICRHTLFSMFSKHVVASTEGIIRPGCIIPPSCEKNKDDKSVTLIRGGGHHQGQNALILFQGPAAELVQVITNPATPHKFMNSEERCEHTFYVLDACAFL